MSNDFKAFMSIEEVSELLGVHYQLVYRLIRSGALPAARIGRVYRVTRADLQAYLEASKQPTLSEAITCSACGKMHRSDLSFPGSCCECGALLCTDCWMRLKLRRCSKHQNDRK